MKTTILIFSILFSAFVSNAQFKIADRLFDNGFGYDTSTSIRIKVIDLEIQLDTKKQKPVFLMEYLDKNGSSFQIKKERNIKYEDLSIALNKNANKGRSENLPKIVLDEIYVETKIFEMVRDVLCGSKNEKTEVVRTMMEIYNTTVLPDSEQ